MKRLVIQMPDNIDPQTLVDAMGVKLCTCSGEVDPDCLMSKVKFYDESDGNKQSARV